MDNALTDFSQMGIEWNLEGIMAVVEEGEVARICRAHVEAINEIIKSKYVEQIIDSVELYEYFGKMNSSGWCESSQEDEG